MHFPDLEVGCDWSTFFTFRFSRRAETRDKPLRTSAWDATLARNTAVPLRLNGTKISYDLPSTSILLFQKNICISYLLRIFVSDMVAMLLSLFPNIKIFGIHTYSQKLNMLYWHNFFFHELEIKQQAGIGFPVKSIHSALYITINSCN